MKEDLHNIDKLFKSSIEDHDEMPSADLWNAIDKKLDKEKVIDITKRYLTLKRVAVILLVLLASISVYEVSKWSDAEKTAKNNDVDNKSAPVTKGDSFTGDKKPRLQRSADSSRSPVNGEAYSSTENAGEESVAEPDISMKGGSAAIGTTTNKESVVEANGQRMENTVSTSKNKIIRHSNVANNDSKQRSVETIENSGDQIAVRTGNKRLDVLRYDEVSPAFPNFGLAAVTGLIDAYAHFSVPSASKLFSPEIAAKQSANPIKITAKKGSRFALTAFYSRQSVANKLNKDRFGMHERDRDEFKRTETASSSFSTGVLAEYAVSDHWSVQSGLNLSRTTIHIEPKIIYARPDDFGNVKFRFNCSAGYSFLSLKTGMPPASGDSLRAFESSNTTQYIGIPLAIKYNLAAGKFRFNTAAGISANILSNQKIKTVIANGGINEKSVANEVNGLKPSYFSGLFQLGVDYYVSKSIALSFIPSTQFALSAINKESPVKSYPRSFGLGAGIRFQL